MAHKNWAVGEEVIATDFNPQVADQIVAQFANAAARTAGWAAPPVGACSHLADTPGIVWTWTGTAWKSGPGGVVARTVDTTPQTSIPTTVGDFAHPTPITWNALPNRLYRVSLMIKYVGITAPPGYIFCYICDAGNTVLQTARATCRAPDDSGTWYIEYVEAPATGSVTRKIRGNSTAGTYATVASATEPSVFMAEDIGAAS